jgi:hypothetical protein
MTLEYTDTVPVAPPVPKQQQQQQQRRKSPPKRLFDLANNDCRWPVVDAPPAAEFLFCGQPRLDGLPYCAAHTEVAYTKDAQQRFASQRRYPMRGWPK